MRVNHLCLHNYHVLHWRLLLRRQAQTQVFLLGNHVQLTHVLQVLRQIIVSVKVIDVVFWLLT